MTKEKIIEEFKKTNPRAVLQEGHLYFREEDVELFLRTVSASQKQEIVEEIEKVFPKKCDSKNQIRDVRGKIMFKCSGRDCTDCLIEIRDNLEQLLNHLNLPLTP